MNQEIKLFKRLLRRNRNFITQPRLRLFALLQKNKAVTMNQLISRLPQQDRATVYRNIKLFEQLGIINRLQLGWHSKIELSDIFVHHHHHLTCLRCGKVYTLSENRIIEKQIARMSAENDFRSMDHQLEIRGYCKNCKVR